MHFLWIKRLLSQSFFVSKSVLLSQFYKFQIFLMLQKLLSFDWDYACESVLVLSLSWRDPNSEILITIFRYTWVHFRKLTVINFSTLKKCCWFFKKIYFWTSRIYSQTFFLHKLRILSTAQMKAIILFFNQRFKFNYVFILSLHYF